MIEENGSKYICGKKKKELGQVNRNIESCREELSRKIEEIKGMVESVEERDDGIFHIEDIWSVYLDDIEGAIKDVRQLKVRASQIRLDIIRADEGYKPWEDDTIKGPTVPNPFAKGGK